MIKTLSHMKKKNLKFCKRKLLNIIQYFRHQL